MWLLSVDDVTTPRVWWLVLVQNLGFFSGLGCVLKLQTAPLHLDSIYNGNCFRIMFCSIQAPIADGADFSFSCPGIGFFGDESDCRLYYICTGIGKVGSPMKCDGDLAWNQKRLACEWKRNLPADICDKKVILFFNRVFKSECSLLVRSFPDIFSCGHATL